MDLSVNAPFKSSITSSWDQYQLGIENQAPHLIRTGNWKVTSREDRMIWISESWRRITAETAAKGFSHFKNINNEDDEQDSKNEPKDIGTITDIFDGETSPSSHEGESDSKSESEEEHEDPQCSSKL